MTPRAARRLAAIALAVMLPCQVIAAVYMIESGEFAFGAATLSIAGIFCSVAVWFGSRSS